MTRLLSIGVILFSVAYNTRLSLKKLKVLTSEDFSSDGVVEDDVKRDFLEECKRILKYWAILGLFIMFENYVEFVFRWFPGWFYAKSAFILTITFPQLRISNMMFDRYVVPFLQKLNKNIEEYGGLFNMLSIFLYSAPFLVVDIIFPAKLQFTDFIKKSFRIKNSSDSELQQTVIDPKDVDIHLVDSVDYFVPSPVLSPSCEDETTEKKKSVLEYSRMSTSRRTSTDLFASCTSPFNFSDNGESTESEPSAWKPNEHSPRPSSDLIGGYGSIKDTSRRLSSFKSQYMQVDKRKSVLLSTNTSNHSARSSKDIGPFDGAQGFRALLDFNVNSPPVTSSQRKLRRETFMNGVSTEKLGLEKVAAMQTNAAAETRRVQHKVSAKISMKETSSLQNRGNFINDENNPNVMDSSAESARQMLQRRRVSGTRRRSMM